MIQYFFYYIVTKLYPTICTQLCFANENIDLRLSDTLDTDYRSQSHHVRSHLTEHLPPSKSRYR